MNQVSKTVGEYKKMPIYSLTYNVIKNHKRKFHSKMQGIFQTLAYLNERERKWNELELFNASRVFEKKFDDFYYNSNYSQFYSWEETMLMLSCVELIRTVEKKNLSEDYLLMVISYFLD